MNESIAIWNTLHDGEITVLQSEEPSRLVMFVSIPYLRKRIEPIGDSFVIRLKGFRSIELSNFDNDDRILTLSEIAENRLEILSTDSNELPVKITTTLGFLTIDFDELELGLDTGQSVSYAEIDRISTEYWDEWSAKSRSAEQGAAANP